MKSQFKNLDTLQIIGFIISIIVSVALLVVGQDTVASLTLGFVLATLTQLLDLQKRHRDSEERILLVSTLSQSLFRDEWLLNHIQRIINNFQLTAKSEVQRELFTEKARAAIDECANTLEGMSKGHLSITHVEQLMFLGELLRTAREQAYAVSYIDFKTWWRSEIGRGYLRENERVVKKGTPIKRIFVTPKDRILELKELIDEHRKAGVEVWVAVQEEQPNELLESYLIVDKSIVSKSHLTFGGQFQGAYITADPYEVKKMIGNFHWLL